MLTIKLFLNENKIALTQSFSMNYQNSHCYPLSILILDLLKMVIVLYYKIIKQSVMIYVKDIFHFFFLDVYNILLISKSSLQNKLCFHFKNTFSEKKANMSYVK